MADAFPNKEQEDADKQIQKKILDITDLIKKRKEAAGLSGDSNIDIEAIIKKRKEDAGLTDESEVDIQAIIDQRKEDAGIEVTETVDENKLSPENDSWLKTQDFKYRDNVSRYLDIFRNNTDFVEEYIEVLKKFGTEKAAKKAGVDNVLFYPNKVLKYIKNNPEIFDEDTLRRWAVFSSFEGRKKYDIAYREDKIGKAKQKLYYGKKFTKISGGVGEAIYSSFRGIANTIALVADRVGPENTRSAVAWIEENWPHADDVTYPNKTKPYNQDSTLQHIVEGLTQFGIDTLLGKKILKAFGWGFKKIAPNYFKKIADRVTAKKPKLDRHGKEIADSFGNIHYVSSYAKNWGFWGLPVKYGIGHALTDDTPKDMTATEAAAQAAHMWGWTDTNLIPPKDKKFYEKMTKRERASYLLKRKLMHGAEGTVLIAGLTKGVTLGGKAIWGGTKWTGRAVSGPVSTVMNPIANIMKSRKTGLPQLIQGIRNTGGFLWDKGLRLPPYKNWAYFSTTQGPLKERILGAIEQSRIITALRVRGPWTKEAKLMIERGEQMVRRYKKDVGVLLTQIDRAIYDMMGKGFTHKTFTSSSVGAGSKHWDNVIAYLRGEVKLEALPKVLREPTKDIQLLIKKLSKQIEPYVKSEEIKKEIIDGFGKYLSTSYRIFQGSFKPDKGKIEAAVKYFVDLLKKNEPKYKNVKVGSKLWPELNRLASQKVDELLQYGKEGSSPIDRLKAITSLVMPDKILKEKQTLPKVIEELLGKETNQISIIMDTVAKQSQLLSDLFVHKSILREGLKSGWIVRDPTQFAMKGVQKWVSRSLKPIAEIARTSNIDIAKIYTHKGGNYWTTDAIANAIKSDALATDIVLQWSWFQPWLAAKTTAQLSKTVLSLMTQSRNFETAMFFSVMQGHIGPQASVMEAMKFVFGDVVGKGPVNPTAMRKKLTEWMDVGVLDSSIVAGEIEAVIGDIIKGRFVNTGQLFKYLLKNPMFRKATEFYQGSDSVWKVYGYEFTKSQLLAAIPLRGLTVANAKRLGYVVEKGRTVDYNWKDLVANQFREVFGMKWNPIKIDGVEKSYGDALREIAGKYIKDVYPNYNLVPNLVKNWRRFPMGNFIAFRAENIRNSFNTMIYSMREMSSSNPFLRQMGAKRMMGLAATYYGISKGISLFTKALTGLDEEWIKKYQRWFVPYYDKTSTLFPVSKPDAQWRFWTLNWTRENPYEGLQDTFDVMFKELFNPVNDDNTMGKRFFNAFFWNVEEDTPGSIYVMFEPFLTPSLFYKAVVDIAPSEWTGGIGKNGILENGSIVFDVRNDTPAEILAKIFGHIWEDINPTTAKNAKQVLEAMEEELTPSGQEMSTVNKIFKMVLGIGVERQTPLNSISFVVSNFTKRIAATQKDFVRDATNINDLIKDPFTLPKKFNELQKNRYREYSRLYDFVKFLRDNLKLSPQEIYKHVKDRSGFSKQTLLLMYQGKFDPANLPPIKFSSIYPGVLRRINNTTLYEDNPLELKDIYDIDELKQIKKKWLRVPLQLNDKQLDHYFKTGEVLEEEVKETEDTSMILPAPEVSEPKQVASVKPQVPLNAANVSAEVIASKPDQNVVGSTGLTATETAYLSNEEKAMRLKQKGLA
jgi:hypothetical protein